MIVIITARGHEYALAPLAKGGYGFPVPAVRITTYDRLLTAKRAPRATYIFTDLDRLASWELRLAADLYRRMVGSSRVDLQACKLEYSIVSPK